MTEALDFIGLVVFLVAVSGAIGVFLPRRRKRFYWPWQDTLTRHHRRDRRV